MGLRRLVDLILIVVIVVGGTFAVRSGRERSDASREYQRLRAIATDMPIGDPAKLHLLAMPTGDPLSFAWRMHVPPNYPLKVRYNSGGGSSSWSSSGMESIARVRIRIDDRGLLAIYARFGGGSMLSNVGDADLANMLRGHLDELEVEQFARDRVAVVAPDKPTRLLRVKLPTALIEEARAKLSTYIVEQCVPYLLEIELGPPGKTP